MGADPEVKPGWPGSAGPGHRAPSCSRVRAVERLAGAPGAEGSAPVPHGLGWQRLVGRMDLARFVLGIGRACRRARDEAVTRRGAGRVAQVVRARP